MAVDESALVLVLPTDTIESVIARVQDSGSSPVELLVPDGVPLLHTVENCERLHQAAAERAITLLLIASDESTLNAAKQTKIELIGVANTRVHAPSVPPVTTPSPTIAAPPPSPPSPAAYHDDSDDLLAALLSSAPPPKTTAPAATDGVAPPSALSDRDQAFMDDLDDLSGRDQAFMDDLDDLSAAFEMDADASSSTSGYGGADDDFAAALDDLSDSFGAPSSTPAATRPRIRPEDIDLSDEEKQRAVARQEAVAADVAAQETRRRIRPEDIELSDEEKQRVSRTGRSVYREDDTPKGRSQISPIAIIIAIIAVILLVVVLGMVVFSNTQDDSEGNLATWVSPAVVVVNPPTSPENDILIEDHPVFLSPADSEETSSSVRADVIRGTAMFTVTGEVVGTVMTPGTIARGRVTLTNESSYPIFLPRGTEFIGTNEAGREVHFVSDEAVTIPATTSVRTGPGIITSFGVSSVPITARAPGSESNIWGNTITRIVIPGQGTVGLGIDHAAIQNGSDEPVSIVKESDVQLLLGKALTGLNSQAWDVLAAHANNRGLILESDTIIPSTHDLEAQRGYELSVYPPIGSIVDPENPTFAVTVWGTFSALATPRMLDEQLVTAFPEQLKREGKLPFGMEIGLTGWKWDGQQLTTGALLKPTGEIGELDAQTRAAIRDSIKGKSRVEAAQALEQFKNQELISGYTLPANREILPSVDFLLNLEVLPPSAQSTNDTLRHTTTRHPD